MLFSSCFGLCLLGLATAAPIAFASQREPLVHADWVNLDHRRHLFLPDGNNIRVVTDVNSRDTTTLRQSQFHLLATNPSNRNCNTPRCVSLMAARESIRLRTVDSGSMVSAFLYCLLSAAVGCVFLTMLLVKLYHREKGACRLADDDQKGVGMRKMERARMADEELSDDFDDTDYPMG